jgi:hypothetical protein
MSFSFFDRGFYDPRLLDGIDPATGLIPFDPPALPPRGPQLDANTLMALLGNPPPDIPTDPNTLMALLAANRSPAAQLGAAPLDFLQTVYALLTGAPAPGMAGPPTTPFGARPLLQAYYDDRQGSPGAFTPPRGDPWADPLMLRAIPRLPDVDPNMLLGPPPLPPELKQWKTVPDDPWLTPKLRPRWKDAGDE